MKFGEFESFVEDIQSNCTVRLRIADNMLEAEDWGVVELIIEDNLVVSQRQIQYGVYQMPEMVGWNTNQLEEWSRWDSTGSPVEEFHEIAIGPNLLEKRGMTLEEVFNLFKHHCSYRYGESCDLNEEIICSARSCPAIKNRGYVNHTCGDCGYRDNRHDWCGPRNHQYSFDAHACPLLRKREG